MLLILGSTTHVIAVVVSCYMVGFSIGSILLGTFADKNQRLALHLSIIGFAVFCALSPLMYQFVDAFARYDSMAARVLVCFLFMLPATLFAGGAVPALIKIGGNNTNPAHIYAANTFGSIAGVLLCGYVLIKTFGLSRTALLAAGAALLCCALAFFIQSQKAENTKPIKKNQPAVKVRQYSKRIIFAIIAVYAVSGFASMTFEVFQTKMLTLFFRGSVYDYTIILTVVLIGFFIGNLIGGRIAKKDNLLFYFVLTQILAGASVIFGLYIANMMPAFTFDLVSNHIMFERYGSNAFLMTNLIKFGYSALVVLLPTCLWGMGFPLVNKMTATDEKSTGKITGLTLGFNTFLCAAGTLLSAFFLVNVFGIRGTIILSGIICVIFGIILAVIGFKAHIRHIGKRKYMLPCAVLLTAALWIFMPKWNKFEMSALFVHPGDGSTEGLYEILFYREAACGVTVVVDFFPFENRRFLSTNRLYRQSASGAVGTLSHQRLGAIPMLIHQNPQDVLVIGLGAGITLRGVNNFPNVNITCVEISRSIVKAARYFGDENADVLDAENVNIIVNDGRNYIRTTNRTYDVIIADIFFPAASGSSNVFSREYYEMCRSRLNPGGIMVQWIPAHQFSPDELAITIKTFASVFENVQLWFGLIGLRVPVIGLVGSEEPIVIDGLRLSEIFADENLRGELSQIALDNKYVFLSNFITNIENVPLSSDTPINTDDRPILEFLNPRMEFNAPGFQRAVQNLLYVIPLKMNTPQNEHFVNIDEETMYKYNSGKLLDLINMMRAVVE